MGRLQFPVVIEKISELYKLDWRSEYYKFITNPYAFYTIPLDKCDMVVINSNNLISNFIHERHLGEMSRFIYNNTKHNKWTATPDWLMQKEYPDHISYKDVLRDNYGLVFNMQLTYLRHIHIEEEEVASFILSNITLETNLSSSFNVKYSDDFIPTKEQDATIKGALSRSTSIITGLAGTGKTTVIKQILRQIRNQKRGASTASTASTASGSAGEYMVCSFTAKAVKRVREIVGDLAYTNSQYGPIWHVRTIHSIIRSIEEGTLTRPDVIFY